MGCKSRSIRNLCFVLLCREKPGFQSFTHTGRDTVLTRISPSCTFPPCNLPTSPITPAGAGDAARRALHRDRAPSPALPAVHVTARLRQILHARPRAITVLAADERVAAEGLGLTDDALWLQGVRRADALTCHLVTETCPAVACWKAQKRGCVLGSKTQAAQGEHEAMDAELDCSAGSLAVFMQMEPLQGWKMQPFPKSASAL